MYYIRYIHINFNHMSQIYYKLEIRKIRWGSWVYRLEQLYVYYGKMSHVQNPFTSFSRRFTSPFSLLRYASTCRLATYVCVGTLVATAMLATIVLDWLEKARDVLSGTQLRVRRKPPYSSSPTSMGLLSLASVRQLDGEWSAPARST